jgi:hypothetical protein
MDSKIWWMLGAFISICFNVGFLIYLWFVRHAVIHVFAGWRNFWNKDKGMGYAIIIHPEKRVEPVFCKFEDKITLRDRTYIRHPSKIYQFLGLPAMFYNENDSNPIDLIEKDKSQEIENDANYLDSVVLKIKAWAEAKAFKKFELIFIILIGVAFLSLLIVLISGTSYFKIDEILEKIMNIPIMATLPA